MVKKSKVVFKIIAVVLIQMFMSMEFVWCGTNELFNQNEQSYLSPFMQVNKPEFMQSYRIIFDGRKREELSPKLLASFEADNLDKEAKRLARIVNERYDLTIQQMQMDSNKELTPKQVIEDYIGNFIISALDKRKKSLKDWRSPITGLITGLASTGKTTFLLQLDKFCKLLMGTADIVSDHNILPKDERPVEPKTAEEWFAKSDLKDDRLVLKLLEEGMEIIKQEKYSPDHVCFDKRIKTRYQLNGCLEQAGISEQNIALVLKIWDKLYVTSEDVTKKFQIKRHTENMLKILSGRTIDMPLFNFSEPRDRVKFYYKGGNFIIQIGSLQAALKEDEKGGYFLYSETKEGKVIKGEEIELGDYTVYTGRTEQNEIVIGIGDTEYVVKEARVGLDTIDLIPQNELEDYQQECKELNPEVIFLKLSEDGNPILEYKNEQSGERLQFGTLRFEIEKVKDQAQIDKDEIRFKEGIKQIGIADDKAGKFLNLWRKIQEKLADNHVLLINGVRYYIPKAEWQNMRLVAGRRWTIFKEGEKRDFLRRFLPGNGVLNVEGIIVTADKEVNSKVDYGVEIGSDTDINILRKRKRAEEKEGRKIKIGRILEMKRQEEAKHVVKWIGQAVKEVPNWIRASSQSIAESLWVRWKHSKLIDSGIRYVLGRLRINAHSLINHMNQICKQTINKQLNEAEFLAGDIVTDDPFAANEIYLEIRGEYGMVLLVPLEQEGFARFKEFYETVLKPRMGDLMVRSAIFDFSELQKKIMVTISDNKQEERWLGEALVKKPTWMSIESRLIEVLNQDDLNNLDKIELVETYLRLFYEHQKAMWKTAGVVDSRPHFHKCGFDFLPDDHGNERIELNHFIDVTDKVQGYNPEEYKRSLAESMDSILEHCRDEQLKEELHNSLQKIILDNIPDKAKFKNKYFGKELAEAFRTPDPFGSEVMDEYLGFIEGLVKNGKKDVARDYYQEIRGQEIQGRIPKRSLSILTWLLVYQHYVSKYSPAKAEEVMFVYDQLLLNPRDINEDRLKKIVGQIYDPSKREEAYKALLSELSLWNIEPISLEKEEVRKTYDVPAGKLSPIVPQNRDEFFKDILNVIEQAI